MKAITCIIVDDERLARLELAAQLEELGNCKILGEANSADAAKELLNRVSPDCIFLDISMPAKDGFTFLAELPDPPLVVFVTAHDEFAVKAFSVQATDYLLKPVQADRLKATLDLLRERLEGPHTAQRLYVEGLHGGAFVELSSIDLLRAYDHYVRLYHSGGNDLLRIPLRDLESRLPEQLFFRCNRSEIIRLGAVIRTEKLSRSRYRITLAGGEQVDLSEARSRLFRSLNSRK